MLLALAVCAFASERAKADELQIGGTTSSTISTTPAGISFLPGSFSGLTSGGFAGFSNLGSYTLSTTPGTYSGTVNLQIAFTVPAGISGGSSTTFVANVFGNISNNAAGGVDIAFTNPTQNFTFSNSSGFGSFTFTVNSVSLNPGGTTAVSGYVTGGVFTPVPEPSGVLLLGAGILLTPLLGLKKLS